MQIFIVLQQNSKFTIIVHAAPNETGRFQWYWMDDPNEGPEINIKGAVHESVTLSSDEIRKCYQEKWLACHCHINGEEFPYNQGCVYLTSDFGEMIRRNRFDKIFLVGEDGEFLDDLCYVPATP